MEYITPEECAWGCTSLGTLSGSINHPLHPLCNVFVMYFEFLRFKKPKTQRCKTLIQYVFSHTSLPSRTSTAWVLSIQHLSGRVSTQRGLWFGVTLTSGCKFTKFIWYSYNNFIYFSFSDGLCERKRDFSLWFLSRRSDVLSPTEPIAYNGPTEITEMTEIITIHNS